MRPLPLFVAAALLALNPVLFAQSAPDAGSDATATTEGEEPKIAGVTLKRPDGRFLGVETEGVTMKITFYDADKKPEPADAIRISARWTDTQPRFTVLLPATAETLVSPGVLKRPFNYIVYLALVGKDEKVMETHSLRLR
jgi:hypothetical protein